MAGVLSTLDQPFEAGVTIYSITPDGLARKAELLSRHAGVRFVWPDYDSGYIVAGDAARWVEAPYSGYERVKLITFERPWAGKICSLEVERTAASRSFLTQAGDAGPALVVASVAGELRRLEACELLSGVVAPVRTSDVKLPLASGVNGVALPGASHLNLYPDGKGRLVFFVMGEMVPTPWTLPPGSSWGDSDRIVLFVHNNWGVVVAAIKDRVRDLRGSGSTLFWVYRNAESGWKRLAVRGSNSAVRGFREWVAGYEATGWQDSPFLGENEWRAGSESRHQRSLPQIRESLLTAGVYPLGRLFTYNMVTGEYCEHDTGQADSEVLLVKGRDVFYRIHNRIYKAKLADAKFTDPEILIQDEAVVDIHWAFFGRRWPEHASRE